MRDSPITRRDEGNPVLFTRPYRRANKVASPNLV
jgi:hypothetical protein